MSLKFTIEKTASDSRARAASFQTRHGEVQTPIFMPVGTRATVKTQTVESLKASGSRVLLANTYHLLLRPGPEVFRRFGGIHRFMNWDGPVLTDSGGYQIFSLPHERSVNEEGARFKSYVDGKTHMLSPESSIEMQQAIGSDIMMALDQCIPSTAGYEEAEAAMNLTHRWAERSLHARNDSGQALFGIVQGACHAELRRRSAAYLSALSFDGLAIGGLAVGETHHERYAVTGQVTADLPENLPRYLMGVGTPLDLLESVHRGVDMFDCIIPSQWAQRGVAFTSQGKIQLRRSVYKVAEETLDADCRCAACLSYSRAYLHHLIKSEEVLGWYLLTIHNLTFYHRLMQEMRTAIRDGSFPAYYSRQRTELTRGDEEHPSRPTKIRRPRRNVAARLGNYEVRTSEQGFSSIRQISSGEVMHSVNRPADEANRLYIEQSCLAARLTQSNSGNPLVLWDVGLGAAWNAMAVLNCFESQWQTQGPALRPLYLASFECDLDSLRLAAKDPIRFQHLRHPAPYALLKSGTWQHPSGLFRWDLIAGDFAECLESVSAPDILFYDPFSYKADSELWTPELFSQIFRKCRTRPAELYTYSASTAVRVALLAAGFFVAAGTASGPKASTTIAFSTASAVGEHPLAPPLLGADWLARWRRSDVRSPANLAPDDRISFETAIEKHAQFALII